MNKIQTFTAFNCGKRRPERKRHLEICGFTRASDVDPSNGAPRGQLIEYYTQLAKETGERYHIVYWQSERNMDGERWYQVWRKTTERGE